MIPASWLSVIAFLVLVAPGLLFDQLSRRRRAGAPESTFSEISRVVLSSLLFSGFAVTVLALSRTFEPAWTPEPGRLLGAGAREYLADRYRLVSMTLLLEVALALAAVRATHWYLSRRGGGATIRPTDGWTETFKTATPAGHCPYARVRLSSGTVYAGRVLHFTADTEIGNRELVLGPPLRAKTGTRPVEPVPVGIQRVALKEADIEVISVGYLPR